MWTETTADDFEVENEARRGGITPTNIEPKLYHDIQTVLSRLVVKANQLVSNETTNLAEAWMHIRSKFDGGKVINRSQSGSWEHRCMGAGLQQNMGKKWGLESWKQVTNSNPNPVFTETVNRSASTVSKNRKRKERADVKAKRRSSKYTRKEDESTSARLAYSRHDDGVLPEESVGDVPPDHLEQLKSGFYQTKVIVTSGVARGVLRVLEHPHQLFSKLLTCTVNEYCTSADQTRS